MIDLISTDPRISFYFGQPPTMNRRPFHKYLMEHGCEKLAAVALQLAQDHEKLLLDTDHVCNDTFRDYKITLGWAIVWRALNKDLAIQNLYEEIRTKDEKIRRAPGILEERHETLTQVINDLISLIAEIKNHIVIKDICKSTFNKKSCLDRLLDKLKSYPSNPFFLLEEENLTLETKDYLEGLLFKPTDNSGFSEDWVRPNKIMAYARQLDLIASKFSEFEKCFGDAKNAKKDVIRYEDELKVLFQHADRWWKEITENAPLMDSKFNVFEQIEGALNPNVS